MKIIFNVLHIFIYKFRKVSIRSSKKMIRVLAELKVDLYFFRGDIPLIHLILSTFIYTFNTFNTFSVCVNPCSSRN